ncbi:hypothetical protein ACS0TY_020850 [Phlomoides rotata]
MAEVPPTETLSPPMDHHNPVDQPNPTVKPLHLSAAVTDTPEKRKREQETEPVPESSSVKAPEEKHPLWKTSLCSYFRSPSGKCSHGETCQYAHGEEELRLRPDNTWDPTSERAKKKAKTDEAEAEAEEEGGVMMTEALEEGEEESSSDLSKCFVNLPMKWTSDNLRNFLNEQAILFKSAKKKNGMKVGFVTFETAEQAKTAVQELDGKSVGNNRTLKISDVLPRAFEKNNKVGPALNTDNVEVDEDGSLLPNGSVLKARSVRDAVTPLAHMSYSEQLEYKKNSLAQTLKGLTRNARKACRNADSHPIYPGWILNSREIGGLPCKLEGIIESVLVNGYRNKCEFSVGKSLQGKNTVGFQLGNFREGVTAVEEPVDCPNVSRIACKYASVFQEFLQQSLLPVWNRLNNTGFWRQLTVREGRKPGKMAEVDNPETSISEVMLIVQVCTLGSDDGKVNDEIQQLAQVFSVESTKGSPPLPLTALVIQDHTGISNVAPPDAPLRYVFIHKGGDCGLEIANDVVEPRIHDHLSNLQFSISPSAFFQVNTLAAEKLYSLAGDWANLGPDTLLFDVCCGTGTIGLTLAHRVGMVVGIEMNASAVSDAQRNAKINGIKNCRFVCGKAEDVIGTLMKEYLSLAQKSDQNSDMSQSKQSEENSAEENLSSADPVHGTEDTSSVDHENGSSASKSNDGTKLDKNCVLETSISPVQQFKNVVAIVDPPRVGLHPTVSDFEVLMCTYIIIPSLMSLILL